MGKPAAPGGHLPGVGLTNTPTEISPGIWQWLNNGNEYEPEKIDRTIAVWHTNRRQRQAQGWYVLGIGADRRPAVRRGPYADDIDVLRDAIRAVRPKGNDRDTHETVERALAQRIHNAATALTLGPHVGTDDGPTSVAEQLQNVQAACDARRRWLERTRKNR